MDWAPGIERRNYGIRNRSGIGVKELLWVFFLLAPVAGALLFQLWVRSQIIKAGYEIQELARLEESLTRTHEKLVVKEEILQSPDRIDRIARGRLGMEPLRPEQILPPLIPHGLSGRSVVAMANGN